MNVLQDHLDKLAEALGLEGLALDDERGCTVVFDEELFVHLEAPTDSPYVALHSVAAIVPAEPPEALFERILALNAEREEPAATIGWDEENGLVGVCCRCAYAALDAPGFVDLYEAFLARTRQIRAEVLDLVESGGGQPAQAADNPEPYIPMQKV